MYKAKTDIGGFHQGDVVPTEKAVIWEKQYLTSPVEFIQDVVKTKPILPKPEVKIEETKVDFSDDYLGRNQNVVLKNIASDKLPQEELKKLLTSEEKNRKRNRVINAITKLIE